MRGGERVLESLSTLFPAADLFTLRYDGSRISSQLARHSVTTSFVDRLAGHRFMRGRFRALLPLFPLAAESFCLDGYDLVISSSHCVAAGVLAPPGALHVAYLHSPMRYAWEAQATYEAAVGGGWLGRWAFRATTHYLRLWDAAASARPDVLIANSSYTRDRIRRYYGRDAEVIEPPVDTERFAAPRSAKVGLPSPGCLSPPEDDEDHRAPFLLVSALVPYKRVELAVGAMAGRPEHLVVIGEGPERARLERMAGPNVSFLGRVDDEVLLGQYRRCRALLHPAVDDFGMVMVEALAAGKPVIASLEGGAAEIVRAGETGVFFDAPTPEAVGAALDRFRLLRMRFDPSRLREAARRFDRAAFERRFSRVVERAARDRQSGQSHGQGQGHGQGSPHQSSTSHAGVGLA